VSDTGCQPHRQRPLWRPQGSERGGIQGVCRPEGCGHEAQSKTLAAILSTYIDYLKAQDRRSWYDADKIFRLHAIEAWPKVGSKWDGEWNARIKDRLERKLQAMVCAGQISLTDARDAIRLDWKSAGS